MDCGETSETERTEWWKKKRNQQIKCLRYLSRFVVFDNVPSLKRNKRSAPPDYCRRVMLHAFFVLVAWHSRLFTPCHFSTWIVFISSLRPLGDTHMRIRKYLFVCHKILLRINCKGELSLDKIEKVARWWLGLGAKAKLLFSGKVWNETTAFIIYEGSRSF